MFIKTKMETSNKTLNATGRSLSRVVCVFDSSCWWTKRALWSALGVAGIPLAFGNFLKNFHWSEKTVSSRLRPIIFSGLITKGLVRCNLTRMTVKKQGLLRWFEARHVGPLEATLTMCLSLACACRARYFLRKHVLQECFDEFDEAPFLVVSGMDHDK